MASVGCHGASRPCACVVVRLLQLHFFEPLSTAAVNYYYHVLLIPRRAHALVATVGIA